MRASFRENKPLQWTRVHDLPDFVYFNHSIHVKQGVGCATCHGPVDKMPLVYQQAPLTMSWCLDCHRNPGKYIRPRDQVFNMAWERPSNDPEFGAGSYGNTRLPASLSSPAVRRVTGELSVSGRTLSANGHLRTSS